MQNVLGMGCRPSEIMEIDDPYTAFCFDEACAVIKKRVSDGEEPIFKVEKEVPKKKQSNKASDIYGKFSNVTIHH